MLHIDNTNRSFAYFECEWKLIVRVKKKKKERELERKFGEKRERVITNDRGGSLLTFLVARGIRT